jgi:hypothetical protein
MANSERDLGEHENQDCIGAGSQTRAPSRHLEVTKEKGRGARPHSIKVKIFAGTGWHMWKLKMKGYLQRMKVWKVNCGESP